MKFDDAINNGYFQNFPLQEAVDAKQLETAVNHFILANDTGKGQVMEINGFLENKKGDTFLAPGDLYEMVGNDNEKELAGSIIARGQDMLAEKRKILVACIGFAKEAVSSDGIKFLDPWEATKIEAEDASSLLAVVNCCFFNYVNAFLENYHLDIEQLNPQPIAFAYHWDCTDDEGNKQLPHVHLMFSVTDSLKEE